MDDFLIEHGHADYDAAELLEQAQANAQALLAGTVAFLAEQGVPAAAWAAALGERFGRAWGEPRPWDAAEFLDAMLTNYRALGAGILVHRLDVDRAEATIGPFPNPEVLASFGLAPDAADAFHDAPAAIAAPRGLFWRWVRDGEDVHFLVERG
jgi:hypothetical protein